MDPANYDPAAQAQVTGASSGGQQTEGAGPNPVGNLRQQLNPVTLTPDELSQWWVRIEASKKRVKDREAAWDILFKEYMPTVRGSGEPEDAKVNAHFANVHTKIGQVFVQSPEVRLTPKGPALDIMLIPGPDGQPAPVTPEEVIAIKQAVINQQMGPDNIDGVRLMEECLFDILAWSGIGCVKVGYKQVSKPYNKPVMQPDPTYTPPPMQPGSILDLAPNPPPPQVPVMGPDGVTPLTVPVMVPIFEEWFADRFSPKKLLLDEQLKSPRIARKSRWIGTEFFMAKLVAKREFGLTDEDLSSACAEDDRVFKHEGDNAAASDTGGKDLIHGYNLYYRCAYFRDDEIHPEVIYELTLIEGIKDRTIVSRPSPDQTIDEMGQLTPDSLIGFPIKVGSLRDCADTPFAPADNAFTNVQVKGINTFRRQSFQLRDAQIGKYLYDTDALDKDDLQRIKDGKVGDFIGVKAGMLANGPDRVIVPMTLVKGSPDDYRTAATLKQDMAESIGISGTQLGVQLDTVRSATEVAQFSADSGGRMEKEKNRAISLYIEIVRAIDTLTVRYAKGSDYVTIVGQDGANKIMKWNRKIIAGKYSYDIKPDSQLRQDAARDRQQKLAFYTAAAPDPLFNRAPVLRDLAREHGYDPAKTVLDQAAQQLQPPHGATKSSSSSPSHIMENSGATPGGPQSAGDNRNERTNRPAADTTHKPPTAPSGGRGVH